MKTSTLVLFMNYNCFYSTPTLVKDDHTFVIKEGLFKDLVDVPEDQIVFMTSQFSREKGIVLGFSYEKVVNLFSLGKQQTEYRLKQALFRLEKDLGRVLHGYIPVVNHSINTHLFTPKVGQSFILKPIVGSNSNGQLKYTHKENLSLSALSISFEKYGNKKITAEELTLEIEKYGFDINPDYYKKAIDGKNSLFNVDKYIASEFIEDIQQEYRIILDHLSRPSLVMKRELLDHSGGHKTPTGVDVMVNLQAFKEHTPFYDELQTLLNYLDIPMCGIDLAITGDGKWTILEFGSGFATAELPTGFVVPWLTSCLVGIREMEM